MRSLKLAKDLRVLLLIPLLVLALHPFFGFPGIAPVMDAGYLLCLIYLVLAYPWLKPKGSSRPSAFEWYLLSVIILPPLWVGLCAYREFGQPVLYGMLAVRALSSIAAVLFLGRALRSGFFTLDDVETSLLVLVWGLSFLYIVVEGIFHVPSARPPIELATQESKFLPDVPVFGFFYYSFRGFRQRRLRDYLLAVALLGFAFAFQTGSARVLTLALAFAFLFFVWRWAKLKRLLILLPQLLLGTALLLSAWYFVMPASFAERVQGFGDAFGVALTGQPGKESSANARIVEVLFAAPQIAKHPMIGNGQISNQWGGGSDEVLPVHFYAADIGLMGVVYQYGLAGLILFSCQYWFALRAAWRCPAAATSPLLDATKGYLLYSALLSIGESVFVFYASTTLFFVALLRAIADDTSSGTGGKSPACLHATQGLVAEAGGGRMWRVT
jgi:hypothetical protein